MHKEGIDGQRRYPDSKRKINGKYLAEFPYYYSSVD